MNKNQVKKSLRTGKIELTVWETVQHYFLLLPILGICIPILLKEGYDDDDKLVQILVIEIGLLLAAAYYVYHQYRALRFKKYKLQHTEQHFQAATKATAIQLGWEIEKLSNNLLVASKELGWLAEGVRITLIRNEDQLFANSLIEPDLFSNPFSMGWNRRNIRVFNNNLLYASQGVDVLSKAQQAAEKEENESEWNFLNTYRRIVIYILIFALMGLVVLAFQETFSIVFIPVFVLCIGYIINDWKIILHKKNRKKQ